MTLVNAYMCVKEYAFVSVQAYVSPSDVSVRIIVDDNSTWRIFHDDQPLQLEREKRRNGRDSDMIIISKFP